MTRQPLTKADVDHLAEVTSDAYSWDRYGSWRGCVALLARRGYTYGEAETILRSKWMRWAADAGGKRYGRATAKDLGVFLDTPNCNRAQLDVMLLEMGLPIEA